MNVKIATTSYFIFFWCLVSFSSQISTQHKPNVLFITIDDMNDWTTVFYKSNPLKTQNLEKLANHETFFSKAYFSSPACNPSRASVMTGMHGVLYENGQWIEGLTSDSEVWEHQWRRKGSQPGFDPKRTSQFLITESTDDGLTWSEPENLTRMCKKEQWWLWATGPGKGITFLKWSLIKFLIIRL